MNHILNIVVILLLGVTALFCWRLNSRIVELKNSRKDMADLVRIFDEAIVNTHKSLASLREVSSMAAADLQMHSCKSEALVSELSFMNDAAARLADRLEKVINDAKIAEKSLQNEIVNQSQISQLYINHNNSSLFPASSRKKYKKENNSILKSSYDNEMLNNGHGIVAMQMNDPEAVNQESNNMALEATGYTAYK